MKELARLNLYSFGLGLPALAGVATGIRLYTGGQIWVLDALVVLAVLVGLLALGRFALARAPQLGACITETWIGSTVIITAFVTDLVLSLTLSEWFPAFLGDATGKSLEKLSAVLVGAVTTFTALVWTKDIADAKGYFWPSTQFKYGLAALHKRLTVKPPIDSPAYYAMFMDTVPGTDIEGWSLTDRHARARIVAAYLASHP